jgi:hypothetical protein
MAEKKLRIKRTAVPGRTPDEAPSFEAGELIMNTTDLKLWAKGDAPFEILSEHSPIRTRSKIEPKSLLIYYGYPVAYNNLWDVSLVIEEIAAHYDIYVIGDGYQDPAHSSYADTQLIVAGLLAKGIEIYGYTPIGGQYGANRPISEIETQIDQWEALNVNGHFLDEFGFDYGHNRARQKVIVDYVHSKGSKYIANSFVFADFAADTIADLPTEEEAGQDWATDGTGWKYEQWTVGNQELIALDRNPEDIYLKENFVASHTGLNTKEELGGVFTKEIYSHNNDNNLIYAITVLPETAPESGLVDWTRILPFTRLEEIAPFVWTNAIVYQCAAVGIATYSFGAAGNALIINRYNLPYEYIDAKFEDFPVWSEVTGEALTRLTSKDQILVRTDENAGIYTWKLTVGKNISMPQFLREMADVKIEMPIDGHILVYDEVNGWKNIRSILPSFKRTDFVSMAGQTEFHVNGSVFTDAGIYVNGTRIKDSEYSLTDDGTNTLLTFNTGLNTNDWVMVEELN